MVKKRLMSEQTLEQKRKISIQDGQGVKLREKITESSKKIRSVCVYIKLKQNETKIRRQ
jgi:hypothetical protein